MKNKHRLIYLGSGLVAVLLLIIIVSCSMGATPESLADADVLYENAVAAVTNASNLSLNITQQKEITVGNETFNETSTQTVTYEGLDSEHLQVAMEETLQAGSHTVTITELYADGVGFFTVEEGRFTFSANRDEYLARYTPAVLLDTSLYSSITGTRAKGIACITFAQPSGFEPWLDIENAELISAVGTAYIDKAGQLTESRYELTYTQGNAYIRQSITVEPVDALHSPIQIPEDTSAYTPISDPNILRLLEIACGHLLEATSVTSTYTDTILCHAFGDQRSQSIVINAVSADQLDAQVDTSVSLSNSGKLGSASTVSKTERFSNGIYTVVVNDGEETAKSDIDAAAMHSYCQDILVGTMALPQYITGASVTETEDTYQIRFTASEDFGQLLQKEACLTLYQDADILSKQAQSYRTDSVLCYLTLHKSTYLPVASGFHYVGIYTIDALPYPLEFRADQQYRLLDDHTTANTEAGAE